MTDIKDEEVTGEKKSLNFIEQIVENDLKEGKNGGKVQTRFPPEPNMPRLFALISVWQPVTVACATFVSTIQTRPKRT